MRVTELTRHLLAYRRMAKELTAKGWEEVGEGGGNLWQLYRGGRTDQRIVAVRIAPGGKSLFVKVEKQGSV